IGGIRHITGYSDRPPVRAGISLGYALASMYAVNSAMMAIYHRDVVGSGVGQYVDVALYEAVFSLMESMVSEYDYKGLVRERTGSSLPGIVPSNTSECGDGEYIVIGGSGDSICRRWMKAIGREDVALDEADATNERRGHD